MFWRDYISPEEGPFKVLLERGEFVDEARDSRTVPYKIYRPIDHGPEKMPVIFWSHGFGGNRDGASFLSRYVASHGYNIVHITHHGTDSSLWEGKKGHPWDILKGLDIPREATLNRFKDVTFAVDELMRLVEENPDIGAHMDFEALGMCGHSFGSMTTQVIGGQLIPDTEETLASYRDERFKAGILYSPVPMSHLTKAPPEQIYGPIAIPLLHMTGTDDDSPIKGFDYTERLLVHEYTGHPEKYLLIKKDGDHMVYNGTRGKLAVNSLRDRHEEIIKVASLAFWDAQLKKDQKAHEWLCGQGMATYIAEDAQFEVMMR